MDHATRKTRIEDRREFLRELGALAGAACLSKPVLAQSTEILSPSRLFRLAVISDCLSQDLAAALKIMKSYGLSWVEIRNVWGKYNTELGPPEIRQVQHLLDDNQFRCSLVDSALFKCELPGTHATVPVRTPYPYSEQMDLLKRAIERAHAWKTDKVRVFSFWRVANREAVFVRVRDELYQAAEVAKAAGIRLLIEDEYDCNVGTGRELSNMLETLPSNVGANWDIGNGLWLGEVPYPDGYQSMDPNRIWNLHLKGVECTAGLKACTETFPDQGQIELRAQFRELLRDGYQETVSVECEFKAPELSQTETTKRALAGVLKVISQLNPGERRSKPATGDPKAEFPTKGAPL